MKILSAEQMRGWDAYTIANEPIASIDLMERAATKCMEWLLANDRQPSRYVIVCGKGNNGGDGLAVARMLLAKGRPTVVYILETGKLGSDDFQTNLQRLHAASFTDIHFVQGEENFPHLSEGDLVVDALFGTGLTKPVEGLAAALIRHINASAVTVVSIDLPSGLYADQSSVGNTVVHADVTLTFEAYKTALLVQENAEAVGEVVLLPIGLHQGYLSQIRDADSLLQLAQIKKIYKPRSRFAHKGSYGHALIAGGSYGKMGAAVLATRACLRAGAGLTTAFVPGCGHEIIQATAPEAMAVMDEERTHLATLPDNVERFDAIAFGPGAGTHPQTQHLLSFLLRRYRKPIVVDADGLNCLALNPDWLAQLPPYSILTPHPKEFDRLFGDHQTDFNRLATARRIAAEHTIIVVLKGHHSFIALPSGNGFFNTTGNAGMAKGGSGDVLTGIIASLMAQRYAPADAALFGVYLHGMAGDLAAKQLSKEAMLPSDLIDGLGKAFLALNGQD